MRVPTYEYECRACGHRFDAFQSMTAAALTRCPHCRKKVDRLISAGAGFLFKGAGFYTTDHRSKPYQEAAKKDQEASCKAPLPLAGATASKDGPGQKQTEAKPCK
jgi:putative FmdB family regulatory protein